ncbi:alanine racemase [bacterium]|nr:alanine racemase [bacterium]
MLQTSYIEISKSALEQNLKFLKSLLKPNVKFSSVVKGNAYGHGIDTYVPIAKEFGVDHFSVFSAHEAAKVMEVNGSDATILIMGMIDTDQLQWAIYNDIEFFVFNKKRLLESIKLAKKIGKRALVHIELETGMNRTGFEFSEVAEIMEILKKESDFVHFKGLCTHYAGAESISNFYRIKKQKKKFDVVSNTFKDSGLVPDLYHTACSAASIRYPKTQMDMVRIGILQYGFFPSREILIDYMMKNDVEMSPLRRLISWKSKVMDIKHVSAGEFVGYGTSYLASYDMRIAVVPVGYSHGFTRGLSNQGRVLLNGERVQVIGMVNMNMMTVDITNVDGVEIGDEVVIIGKQGHLEISVSSFSEFSDQVNYELLTRLPHDIPRKIIE